MGIENSIQSASECFFADPLKDLNPQGETQSTKWPLSTCERKWPWAQDLLLSFSNNIFTDDWKGLARVSLMKMYLQSYTKPEKLSKLHTIVTLSISQVPLHLLCRAGCKNDKRCSGSQGSQGSGAPKWCKQTCLAMGFVQDVSSHWHVLSKKMESPHIIGTACPKKWIIWSTKNWI